MPPLKKKVIIIGGGSAGASCAFFLRKMNKEIEITILEKGKNTLYSPCALPYIVSEKVDKKNIFVFKEEDYKSNNINLVLNSEVKKIDTEKKEVVLNDEKPLSYDFLVIANGSTARNIDETNLFVFKSLADYERLARNLKENSRVSIIGGGSIGVELAVSLSEKGNKVIMIELKDRLLKEYTDESLSRQLEDYLIEKGVNLCLGTEVVKTEKDFLEVKNKDTNKKIEHDIAISCIGSKPNTELAKAAGLSVSKGIIVNEFLETSSSNVFACGDCVESRNFITNKPELSMLGSTAVRQAKVVAKNILQQKQKSSNNLNVFISKIGSKYMGGVGITTQQASAEGIKFISAAYTGNVYSEYYSEKEKITYVLVSDAEGKLIGAQLFSDENIAGRLNALSIAIESKMTAKNLAEKQTCYNPLCAPIIDPVTICADILCKKIGLI